MFTGIFLTGIRSPCYHYAPDNNTLVFDRLPKVQGCMAFLSAAIMGWINARAGELLLFQLLLLGMASVLWWHYTELKGAGDLLLCGFVQFYPMLIIPIIFLLFASPENNSGLLLLVGVIGWYAAAKGFELPDAPIYRATGFLSDPFTKTPGGCCRYLYMVKFFQKKYGLH